MRFVIGAGTRADESLGVQDTGPEVIIQLGDSKTPLLRTQLLSATRASRRPDPEVSKPRAGDDEEERALEALSRMQESLSPRHPPAEGSSSWMPWSPDDLYHPSEAQRQPGHPFSNTSSDTLPRPCREASDANLPAYYDPAEQPYYLAQQTSASAIRDMALHKGGPTIFDKLGEAPSPRHFPSPTHMKKTGPNYRRKTTGASSTQRKLDLVQFFPQPRQSTGPLLSPSRLQRSPSPVTDRVDFPSPPLPTGPNHRTSRTMSNRLSNRASGGRTGRAKHFEEDIFEQHKTNVRRPPKGIQNWFDAYLSSENEDEDDGADADVDELEPQPQELPADEVLPPAYSGPTRNVPRVSEVSQRAPRPQKEHVHRTYQSLGRPHEQAHIRHARSFSDSNTSNSIQSSHQGHSRQRITGESRPASSPHGGESVLSLSESEYDDEDEDDSEHHGRAKIRDSIFDDRNITIANASSIDVFRLQRPTQLATVRSVGNGGRQRASDRSSLSASGIQQRDKPPPGPQHQTHSITSSEQAAIRRLNGLSLQSADTNSSGTSFQDLGDSIASDTAHMMAVTDEEMMLLDLMRRKRAAMQQLSFTEGYQLALRSEQRESRRIVSEGERALRPLKKKENPGPGCRDSTAPVASPNAPSQSDMRRRLSMIRKESVDERFSIERFLGMSQPQPLSSHPPDASMLAERPHDRASAELLPPTRYSPAAYSPASNRTPAATVTSHEVSADYFSDDDCDTESAIMRVRQFISTNGAVPPLGTIRTMRRRSFRRPPSVSVPPSPILEESHAPPVPLRSSGRPSEHDNFTDAYPSHSVSSVSLHDEPEDCSSPVSSLRSYHGYVPISIEEQMRQTPQFPAPQKAVYVPPRPDAGPTDHSTKSVSPTGLPPNRPTSSPFSNLIQAAASAPRPFPARIDSATKVVPQRVDSAQSPPKHHLTQSRSMNFMKPTAIPHRASLPRLKTPDTSTDQRSSFASITSAGEEVLNAWAELGGGRDALRSKRRSP